MAARVLAPALGLLTLFGLGLGPAARPVAAATLLVPEQFLTLDAAIPAAHAGDTLSVAPSQYTKVPVAFQKAILIRGRGATPDLTVLAGLKAGKATIENVTFQLPANPGNQTSLVEVLDSLTVRDCVFQSPTTGISLTDASPTNRTRLLLKRCTLSNLIQAARLAPNVGADVRVALEDCTITDCSIGVEVSATGAACVPGAPPAPPIVETDIQLTLLRCTFEHTTEKSLTVSGLSGGALIDHCAFNGHDTGIFLSLTGLLMRDSAIRGNGGTGRGIVSYSSRLEMAGSIVAGNDVGITVRNLENCRHSSGVLGGSVSTYNLLGGNTTWNLDTTDELATDYNYWNAPNCVDALARVTGQGLGFITDEIGTVLGNCAVAVSPTTWSRLKAAYGKRPAGGRATGSTAPEGRH